MFIYTWLLPGGVIGLLLIFCSLFYKKQLGIAKNRHCIIVSMIGFIAFWFNYEIHNILYAVNILVLPICISFLLRTPTLYKIKLMAYIRDVMFYLLLLSLPFFLLHLCGLPFIDLGSMNHECYEGNNYVFYFYQSFYGIRFNSLFCEPGHLGMILGFLLYCQQFNFRNKRNVFLFICLLFTFSLAAYVLVFVGYIVFLLNARKIKKVVLGGCILLLIIVVAFNIPIVYELILKRLVVDSDTGMISGDNRVNWATLHLVQGLTFKDLVWGYGEQIMEKEGLAGTGFLIHVIKYGFIGVFLIFIYYISIFLWNKRNLLNYGLFFLYIISFYQRSYALWACELILFVLFMEISNKLKNGKKLQHNYSE